MKRKKINKKALSNSIAGWTNNMSTAYAALVIIGPLSSAPDSFDKTIALLSNLFLAAFFFVISYNSNRKAYGKS